MQLELIKRLIEQYVNVWTLILGSLCLILVLLSTLWAKDLRMSICIFLLAVVFTSSQNGVMSTTCYILRWLLLVLITTRVLRGGVRIKFSVVQVLFFLWTVVAIMSAFQAPSVFRGLVFGIVYLLCFFVFFILILGEIDNEERIHRWLKMLTFLAWTFVLLSFVIYISDPGGYRLSSGRLALLFASSGIFARALVFAATMLVWNGLREKSHFLRQIANYVAVFLCVFLIFLTGSRASLGGLAITLVVLGLHYRKKMTLFIIPVLVVGAIYIVPKILATATPQYVAHMTTLEAPQRPMLRERGFQLFSERPIRGWGLGSLSDPYANVCGGYVSLHNVYLNWLVEFGLLGFIIVMIVVVYTFVRAWKLALFSAQTDYIKDVGWYLAANLTSWFIWEYVEGVSSQTAQLQFYMLFIFIVLTECLVRINRQIAFGQEPEYSDELYLEYGGGITANA
jgi:O-antigen ligase